MNSIAVSAGWRIRRMEGSAPGNSGRYKTAHPEINLSGCALYKIGENFEQSGVEAANRNSSRFHTILLKIFSGKQPENGATTPFSGCFPGSPLKIGEEAKVEGS